MSYRTKLHHLTDSFENSFDDARRKLKHKLGWTDPVRILTFRGFGTTDSFHVHGRVLEDEAIQPPEDDDNLWDNFKRMYRRYETDEYPDLKVEARFGEQQEQTTTGEEGHFQMTFDFDPPLDADQLWRQVDLRLPDDPLGEQQQITATAEVLTPRRDAQFLVVSDVDDTIMRTSATNFLKHIVTVLANNARTRKPFAGVDALYRSLHADGRNPVFYLSSSPWNIYDLITGFIDLHDMPAGPVLLKDFGLDRDKLFTGSHRKHKLGHLRTLIQTYDLPLICFGDSGQADTEIYHQLAVENPGRVDSVYIRNVTDRSMPADFERMRDELAEQGVPLRLVADSAEAATDLAERGRLPSDAVDPVRHAVDAENSDR